MRANLSDKEFKKSSFSGSGSGSGSGCVSVAIGADAINIRDTKDTKKTTLRFTVPEWHAFIAGVKNGEFNIK